MTQDQVSALFDAGESFIEGTIGKRSLATTKTASGFSRSFPPRSASTASLRMGTS